MAAVVARAGAGVVVGHLRGEPRTMQRSVRFADVLGEVSRELAQAVARARAAGVEAERIVVDPGIGFGKLAEHSAALTLGARLIRAAVGYPVLIGVSRKSVLGALLGPTALPPLDDRVLASVVAAVLAVEWGASAVRVHDVAETVAALRVRAGLHAGLARAQTAASE
jgi:dihydropteroate synthase